MCVLLVLKATISHTYIPQSRHQSECQSIEGRRTGHKEKLDGRDESSTCAGYKNQTEKRTFLPLRTDYGRRACRELPTGVNHPKEILNPAMRNLRLSRQVEEGQRPLEIQGLTSGMRRRLVQGVQRLVQGVQRDRFRVTVYEV
eukprot:Gregarina_sp_Poly_1__2949@NODE_1825_length_3265_cov_362_510944_g1184_i0_p2_GENE_NODE_1825_length_3265_cov_362_510944_g1184_i0NODE_1825_length_3265_cov_362_510944_g1184_i0_p2_ORF_typecomplete_len143_score17_22_NODE_1825_length_3265_cov_362_510944_g1184_i027733201